MIALPLIWVLISSVKTNTDIYSSPFGLPTDFRWDTYVNAWQRANIGRFFLNSIVVVSAGVVLTMVSSSMVAYVLARYRFFASRIVYYLFIVGLTFPLFLAIVPLVKVAQSLDLYQNKLGLILIFSAFSLPFSVFFLVAFFQSMPSELADAALIDGAGHYRIFFSIMLPLAKPGLISVGIFNFLGQWNQFLLPVVLNPQADAERSNFLLTQGLADLALRTNYVATETATAEMFAGLTIAIVPVVIVYILFQRKVHAGLRAGALK
jgi:N-acetylglucosamine transport system permease protein